MTLCEETWSNRLALRTAAEQHRHRGAVSVPRSLDGVDQAIIEALQKNGREPFRRIAADVGVSEATIRALGGVVSTESFLYLELWKQLYDWGARAQSGLRVEAG